MLSALNQAPPPHVAGPNAYVAPKSGDARSPCPFLNTLANHGYINRNGKYVTLWAVSKAMQDCYNFDFTLSLFIASAGIYTSIWNSWNPLWFNLDELNVHNGISVEHDASLTRRDISEGDNLSSVPAMVDNMLTYSSSPDGMSAQDFAAYRVLRESNYPPLSKPRDTLCTGEIGLIIPSLGRGDFEVLGRRIHPEWVKSFFGPGKLPDDWVKQQEPVTIKHVGAIRAAVQAKMTEIRSGAKTK